MVLTMRTAKFLGLVILGALVSGAATGCQRSNSAAGAVDAAGAAGTADADDAAGAAGADDAAGAAGAVDAAGADDAAGATGRGGAAGVTGVTGRGGAAGVTGVTGRGGAAGATGVTGRGGAAGATGVTGRGGAAGAAGVTGVTGRGGAAGVTGRGGAAGVTGVTGRGGAAGATGVGGATGAAGATGGPCTPESDSAFCLRVGTSCGSATGTDTCGNARTVASCGTCGNGQTCGGSGVPGLCGDTECQVGETLGGGGFPTLCGECSPEDDVTFCVRQGKTCGTVTAADSCWVTRSVVCGTCSTGSCGGGGNPNVCGDSGTCSPEPDEALCARFGRSCGTITALDNCGQARGGASCGPACDCSDGVDNDGDGLTDWPDDLGCSGPDDNEAAATGQIKNGWTAFKASADTKVFYASDSLGSDTYDGASPTPAGGSAGPKKTLAAAVALLRSGHPDWLLLRRGDTFARQTLRISASGASASQPLLVSSYGPLTGSEADRPLLDGSNLNISRAQHVAVTHIAVKLPVPNTSQAAFDIEGSSDILVEGCRFDGGNAGGTVNGAQGNAGSNLRLRRNVVYEPDGHGIFVHNTTTALIEENFIYHPRTVTTGNGDRHGMYVAREGNSNFTVRGNLIWMNLTENRGNGIMMRPGGVAQGNVIVGAAWTGIPMGACCDGGAATGSNGPVLMDGNLVLDSPDVIAGLQYDPKYTLPGARVIHNIVMRTWTGGTSGSGYFATGLKVGGDTSELGNNTFVDAPVSFSRGQNIRWHDNVMFGTRGGPLVFTDQLNSCPGFQAQNDRYYPWVTGSNTVSFSAWQAATGETGSAAFSLAKADCSLGTYNATLGGTSDTQTFFATAATAHGKFDYDPRFSSAATLAYIRACVTAIP
jgi:hypothetical protein